MKKTLHLLNELQCDSEERAEPADVKTNQHTIYLDVEGEVQHG